MKTERDDATSAGGSRNPAWVAEVFASMRAAIGAVVIGQDEAVRLSVVTLLCSGHSLYEGVPGVAKTLLVRTLAATLGIRFGRVQCTPDLMPTDIIGTCPSSMRAPETFGFARARCSPTCCWSMRSIARRPKLRRHCWKRCRSGSATVDGVTYPLGEWFTVLATQNPIER